MPEGDARLLVDPATRVVGATVTENLGHRGHRGPEGVGPRTAAVEDPRYAAHSAGPDPTRPEPSLRARRSRVGSTRGVGYCQAVLAEPRRQTSTLRVRRCRRWTLRESWWRILAGRSPRGGRGALGSRPDPPDHPFGPPAGHRHNGPQRSAGDQGGQRVGAERPGWEKPSDTEPVTGHPVQQPRLVPLGEVTVQGGPGTVRRGRRSDPPGPWSPGRVQR